MSGVAVAGTRQETAIPSGLRSMLVSVTELATPGRARAFDHGDTVTGKLDDDVVD